MMYRVDQPSCEGCGLPMKAIGLLPPINGRVGVQVFKCDSCRRIASREQPRLPKDILPQLDRIRTHAPERNAESDPLPPARTER